MLLPYSVARIGVKDISTGLDTVGGCAIGQHCISTHRMLNARVVAVVLWIHPIEWGAEAAF